MKAPPFSMIVMLSSQVLRTVSVAYGYSAKDLLFECHFNVLRKLHWFKQDKIPSINVKRKSPCNACGVEEAT